MGPRISSGLLNTRTASGDFHNMEIDDVQDLADSGHPGAQSYLEKFYEKPEGYFTDENYSGPGVPDRANNPHQAGLLNTRTAVNTEGMDPNSHAYGLQKHDPLFGEFGHDGYDYEGVSQGEYNRRTRDYDADAASQEAREQEDDESGYNWGPEPEQHFGSRLPFDRTAAEVIGFFGIEDFQDPDDFFSDRERKSYCTMCKRPRSTPSGPFCHHGDGGYPGYHASRTAGWLSDHLDGGMPKDHGSWEETEDGWSHPTSKARVNRSEKYPGEWEISMPTTSKTKPYVMTGHHPDPQVLMDDHSWQNGYADAPEWHGDPKWWHRVFAPPLPPHTADLMQQQQPLQGGGYQLGHRVGLIWRGQLIPGTVIALDGPNVVIRWDDGQYSTEEPRNIQLL